MNKSKYEIGDRLPETNIFIRGIANLSNGKQRYFLQAGDNTFVFESSEIENLMTLAKYLVKYTAVVRSWGMAIETLIESVSRTCSAVYGWAFKIN